MLLHLCMYTLDVSSSLGYWMLLHKPRSNLFLLCCDPARTKTGCTDTQTRKRLEMLPPFFLFLVMVAITELGHRALQALPTVLWPRSCITSQGLFLLWSNRDLRTRVNLETKK